MNILYIKNYKKTCTIGEGRINIHFKSIVCISKTNFKVKRLSTLLLIFVLPMWYLKFLFIYNLLYVCVCICICINIYRERCGTMIVIINGH
jgi:hypothetical protein